MIDDKKQNIRNIQNEFILRYPEKRLEEILDLLDGKFIEAIPKSRRINLGEDYITIIRYVGENKYDAKSILEENRIQYENNSTRYTMR
jgi:hypothetical protein